MDNYLATTFCIGFRIKDTIYAAVIEDFMDIAPLVCTKWGYIDPSRATSNILMEYARQVVKVDSVMEFERKAKQWNKRHHDARYRGYYFEIAVCRVLGAKRNPVRNTKHSEGYDAWFKDGEGFEIKFIKGVI